MTLGTFVYCCVHRRTVPLSQATLDPLTGLYVCHVVDHVTVQS